MASALDFAGRTRRGNGIFAPFHPAYRNIITNSFHHQWMTCRPSNSHVLPARPSQNFKIFSQLAREHVIIRLEASSSLNSAQTCPAQQNLYLTSLEFKIFSINKLNDVKFPLNCLFRYEILPLPCLPQQNSTSECFGIKIHVNFAKVSGL